MAEIGELLHFSLSNERVGWSAPVASVPSVTRAGRFGGEHFVEGYIRRLHPSRVRRGGLLPPLVLALQKGLAGVYQGFHRAQAPGSRDEVR